MASGDRGDRGAGPGAEDVLRALKAEDFPESRRRNVRLQGDKRLVQGMCLGITNHWTKGPWMSLATKEHSGLASLLCAFAQQELPGVRFTSIQVNKDYRATLHVDKNNLGPSWIIGLGDYTGGRLWIDDDSKAGRAVDIHGSHWFQFDGNRPHCVLPFRGRRFTLVYFTYCHPKVRVGVPLWVQRRLAGLGFPLPPEAGSPPPLGAVAAPSPDETRQRLAAARQLFRCFRARVLALGGVGHVCLQVRDPSGRIHRVGLSPRTPLRRLAAAIAQRLAGSCGERPLCAAVCLAVGSLRLLPGDTAEGLGLEEGQVIDVHPLSDATACKCGEQLALQAGARDARAVLLGLAAHAWAADRAAGAGEEAPAPGGAGCSAASDGPESAPRGLKRPFSFLGA